MVLGVPRHRVVGGVGCRWGTAVGGSFPHRTLRQRRVGGGSLCLGGSLLWELVEGVSELVLEEFEELEKAEAARQVS